MHSKSVPRRQHSAELKAKVLGACSEPGASISAVALAHGLNANLVRKWLVGRGLKRAGIVAPLAVKAAAGAIVAPSAAAPLLPAHTRLLPIGLSTSALAAHAHADTARVAHDPIHVELRRGALHVSVRWPSVAAGECTAWLRELSAGVLK